MRKARVRSMAVGKVRRITLKQAKSYQRSVPNGMGVTSIASVNGPGAYGLSDYTGRYAQTQSMLGRGMRVEDARMLRMFPNPYDPIGGASAVVDRPTPEQMEAALERRRPLTGAAKKSAERKRKREEAEARKAAAEVERMAAAAAKAEADRLAAEAAKEEKQARSERASTGRASSTSGARKMAKKKAKKKGRSKSKKKALVGRKYGPKGKFQSIRARVGKRTVRTYARATKTGAAKIPTWALIGAKSARELKKAQEEIMGPRTKRADSLLNRLDKLAKLRKKAAESVLEGKSLFYPNARVVSYEDLMNENGKKKKKKAKKSKAKKSAKAAKAAKKHKGYGPHLTKAQKKANSKRRSRARSEIKSLAKLLGAFKPARSKKKTAKKITKIRKSARKGLTAVKAYFANGGGMYDANGHGMYDENAYGMYDENRRGRHGHAGPRRRGRKGFKKTRRRHYEENGFAGTLLDAVKTGSVAVGGFLVHRALAHFVDDMVLGKVTALQSGTGAKVRPILSGLITIAAGIPLTDMAGKGLSSEQRNLVKTGMVVSFVQGAIVSLLKGNEYGDKVVGYLAGYPQAYRGYGEYMATSGMGEYMATSGMGEYMATSGFGAFEQAAAGYGAIEQAAAGYGAIEQAAAGYGAIEQAAAGMGEYMATGVQGIGDYDVRAPAVYSGYGQTDEGIMPNTSAAEYALSVAEATSGIGDAGALSIVNPSDLAVPVGDGAEALRTGVLQGGDGIFG